jgi:hypothetical protein
MFNEYLASAVWQPTTMTERRRRDYEEASGRLAASWSRGLNRVLGRTLDRALDRVRITRFSRRSRVASRGSARGS